MPRVLKNKQFPKKSIKSLRISKTPTKTKKLKFKNPFSNGNPNKIIFDSFRSQIPFNGLTSVEEYQRLLRLKRQAQQANAGLLKGKTKDDFSIALPQGVASVEDRDKKLDAARKIQMQNAKILTAKDREKKALLKAMKKRKLEEAKRKTIEYFALREDEDGVPAEYQESVDLYYRLHPDVKETVKKKRELYKLNKDIIALRKKFGMAKNPDEANKDDNNDERDNVLPNATLSTDQRIALAKQEYEDLKKQEPDFDRLMHPDDNDGTSGSGFRSPFIFEMLRPVRRRIFKSGKDQVQEQENTREARKEKFKEFQKEKYGIEPPDNMINRAVPKTAEPVMDFDVKPPSIEILPRPFLQMKTKIPIMSIGVKRRVF